MHLKRTSKLAEFPDCKAARSARHLRELSVRLAAGKRAVQLFVVQRTECEQFKTAGDLHPACHAGLREAYAAGGEVLCYDGEIDPHGIALRRRIPWTGAE